jgi:glycerophosphoryl diester phosphodiesterase
MLNKLIGLALITVLSHSAFAQNSEMKRLLDVFNHQPEKVMVAAHRGGHINFPENSLPSIDEAVEAGAEIVELDVRETKDGVMVILHDRTLDRTTTGKGEVKDFTYAELQQLFLTHNGVPTIHKIPTFKEAMAYAKNRILIDVDFKISGMEARERAYEMIKEVGVEPQILFFVYDYKEMEALYKINPKIKVMPRANTDDQIREIIDLKMTNVIHVDPSFENSKMLAIARSKGIRLWINTLGAVDVQSVNNQRVYGDFLKKFHTCNIIQTDFPKRLKTSINSLKK